MNKFSSNAEIKLPSFRRSFRDEYLEGTVTQYRYAHLLEFPRFLSYLLINAGNHESPRPLIRCPKIFFCPPYTESYPC